MPNCKRQCTDNFKRFLLFYSKIVGDIEACGFKINLYDPSVVNMMVVRKQLAVCWHVDDLKDHAWKGMRC